MANDSASMPVRPRQARTTTNRLLDVMLDVPGVLAAFIANDAGELVFVRFNSRLEAGAMKRAMSALMRLRQVAASGVDSEKSVVLLPTGLLFARRIHDAYLCALTVRHPDQPALDMSARLVARSLPKDARWAVPAQHELEASARQAMLEAEDDEEEDDDRDTLPWTRSGGPVPAASRASLKPPRLPREFARAAPGTRPVRPSGVVPVGSLRGYAARATRRSVRQSSSREASRSSWPGLLGWGK